MRDKGLIFVPSVGPGYNDVRIRPWNAHNTKARRGTQQTNPEVKSQGKKGGTSVVRCVALPIIASELTLVRRPASMGQRPVSLLDCGLKMHANERAFREVKDRQYFKNRRFVPMVPRLGSICPSSAYAYARGGFGIFSLSPQCVARIYWVETLL